MNIRLAASERLNTSSDYLGTPTGHLDLTGFCADFYPQPKSYERLRHRPMAS